MDNDKKGFQEGSPSMRGSGDRPGEGKAGYPVPEDRVSEDPGQESHLSPATGNGKETPADGDKKPETQPSVSATSSGASADRTGTKPSSQFSVGEARSGTESE